MQDEQQHWHSAAIEAHFSLWLHWTLHSWCFISFIIINDRNVLIERKMMFMLFINIFLRTIWISFPSLWTLWGDTAKGSVLPELHTPGLASKAPREPQSSLGAECMAKSPNSLKILIILCVCTHCWPWSIKTMFLQDNKNLICGSFPKPLICSLPCYQNEWKKKISTKWSSLALLEMCISQHSVILHNNAENTWNFSNDCMLL